MRARLTHHIDKHLGEEIRFFRSWINSPKGIGSVLPTSGTTARKMASLIEEGTTAPVLELGPGTGAITKAILARGVAPGSLYSVEYAEEFIAELKAGFPGVNILHGDAFELDDVLPNLNGEKFNAVISAVPMLCFPVQQRIELLNDLLDRLYPGRPVVQLCYGRKSPVPPCFKLFGRTTGLDRQKLPASTPMGLSPHSEDVGAAVTCMGTECLRANAYRVITGMGDTLHMPQTQFTISTSGPGLYEFTGQIEEWVRSQNIATGLVTLFVRHTSCSLIIQENADPDVQKDLQAFFSKLVPRADDPAMAYLVHRAEGADDMPAHIKAALTQASLSIPVMDGRLALGTWQGIYLFEHRDQPHTRKIVMHLSG